MYRFEEPNINGLARFEEIKKLDYQDRFKHIKVMTLSVISYVQQEKGGKIKSK